MAGRDGTDTLTNVEALQFTNANVLIASGSSANPVDLSDNRLFFNAAANSLTAATGSNSDYVKISQNLSGHLIDLGACLLYTSLTAVGTISISDVDQNQSSFQTTVMPASGTLGHLTICLLYTSP